MLMNESYITNLSYAEVSDILKTIQAYVAGDKFIISRNLNRKENNDFIRKYNLTVAKIKNIISKIETEDFCHGLQNTNVGFEYEILYVFCPQVELPYGAKIEIIDIYAKFNIINNERVIVISFHQRNYPVDYVFKQK